MAGLAIAYVAVGFASDDAPANVAPILATAETILTFLFIAEFAVRLWASESRIGYLRSHAIDLVALLPTARGLRIARLIRLLRLVRTFTSLRRVMTDVERLSDHHGLGTLVIAWFGVMFLCSSVFFSVENGVNPGLHDPGDAVWWGIATLTGGTTAVQPVTFEGRLAMGVLLVVGVALFTAITAVFVSFLLTSGQTGTRLTAPANATALDPFSALEQLAALARSGAITPDEHDRKRAQLLDRI